MSSGEIPVVRQPSIVRRGLGSFFYRAFNLLNPHKFQSESASFVKARGVASQESKDLREAPPFGPVKLNQVVPVDESSITDQSDSSNERDGGEKPVDRTLSSKTFGESARKKTVQPRYPLGRTSRHYDDRRSQNIDPTKRIDVPNSVTSKPPIVTHTIEENGGKKSGDLTPPIKFGESARKKTDLSPHRLHRASKPYDDRRPQNIDAPNSVTSKPPTDGGDAAGKPVDSPLAAKRPAKSALKKTDLAPYSLRRASVALVAAGSGAPKNVTFNPADASQKEERTNINPSPNGIKESGYHRNKSPAVSAVLVSLSEMSERNDVNLSTMVGILKNVMEGRRIILISNYRIITSDNLEKTIRTPKDLRKMILKCQAAINVKNNNSKEETLAAYKYLVSLKEESKTNGVDLSLMVGILYNVMNQRGIKIKSGDMEIASEKDFRAVIRTPKDLRMIIDICLGDLTEKYNKERSNVVVKKQVEL